MFRKKQRGQARKLERLRRYLTENTAHFPDPDGAYCHWHMPCRDDFLNSPKTSSKAKSRAMQCVLDCAHHLYAAKPKEAGFCRVVCIFSVPDLWDSQIIVFFDADYFNSFFNRRDDDQRWTEIQNPSMSQQRNLKTIPGFSEKCYAEEIRDDGQVFRQRLWVYGELEPAE